MKKEIYISWCEEIAQDKEALKLIKKSKIISGIELCNLNKDIELIKQAGLKVNIHNPLRNLHIGLEDRKFIQKMNSDKIKMCNQNDEEFIGFHAYYHPPNHILYNFLSKLYFKKNISFLKKKINKKIIIESPPFMYRKERKNVSSPENVMELLKYVNGYLFDISHNFLTMKNLKNNGKDYRENIIKVTKGKVMQMHLNCPLIKNEKYCDSHSIFNGRKYEKEVLDFAKEVLDNNLKLKVITLEMTTNNSPKNHVKKLINQAVYLKEKLKI